MVQQSKDPDLLIHTDSIGIAPEERRRQQKGEVLYASMLRVPRRPPWNDKMSVEELDTNEKRVFLEWRRDLAKLKENEKLILTPFEKNLDTWRQLWRVLELSDLLVMVVDARDPLFYRCPDVEVYAQEIDEHKKTLLLLNKADLLPYAVRQKWANYFRIHGILFLFWSAKAASAVLERKKLNSQQEEEKLVRESSHTVSDTKVYGRDELLVRLQMEAKATVASRRGSINKETQGGNSSDSRNTHPASNHVVVGFIGYPNVGKSSTINALVGGKRTGVTSIPGKTKHFQTLILSDELILCDCPGLVFPSFSSSKFEMVASGFLPIDRMTTKLREAVQVVANHVPRGVFEKVYNITLPKPGPNEPQTRPPLASELLSTYCSSCGHVSSSGLPDETRAGRQILKDYIDGKIPHFEMPPGTTYDILLNKYSCRPTPQIPWEHTDIKVYKRGALDRSVNLSLYTGYDDLKCDLAHMFNIQLEDCQRLGWKFAFCDNENDALLMGDDSWEEFVKCVRCIKILSPEEVQQMGLDAYADLGNTIIPTQMFNSSGGSNAWRGGQSDHNSALVGHLSLQEI